MDERSMIKRCYWKGFPVNCALIFKTFPSDQGMCCTFNMDAADKMLKESR